MNQGSCLKKYVAYYRVSTKRQGRSGLGLEAQRGAVERFISAHGQLLGEYTDIESGKRDQREALLKAIKHVRDARASLLIARLDRFSRRVSFIASMMEKGVPLVIAEMPHASEFQLHIFAALAQEERRLISHRTRAALQIAKSRGVKLGVAGELRALENRRTADAKAAEMLGVLRSHAPVKTLMEAAELLGANGFRTVRGGQIRPQTVKNYLGRMQTSLRALFEECE